MYSNDLVCDILIYINNNIENEISVQEIADKFYFNRYYVMKLFKRELKITINEYINKKRIYNCLIEIKNSNDSFLNIGLNNGFNSLEYFSETFKNIIGVSPRIYKKFTYFIIKTTDEETNIIRINLLNLQVLMDNIVRYIQNRKPVQKTEKKLSIFW